MGLFPAVDTIDTISANVEIQPFAETLSLAVAADPRVLGVDVSKWQGVMDWGKCAAAGAKFAFIRAGSIDGITGICYTDDQWNTNKVEAPKHLPIGAYWYFRPQFNPVSQADYFCNLISGVEIKLAPVLDVETNGGLSPAAYADAIKAFLDRVEALTGEWPLIYTSVWKWAQVEPRPYWPNYELWVAHYTPNVEPLIPPAWYEWTFWQQSSTGPGATYGAESDSIDLDYFNGDEQDLADYIGVLPTMPSVVQVIDPINAVLRGAPKAGERLGIAFLDEQAAVLSEGEDVDGKLWYEIVIKSAGIIRRGFVPASSVVIIVID